VGEAWSDGEIAEALDTINLASATPSKMRFLTELGECLRVRAASRPPSTNCWRATRIGVAKKV
jgi:hypothetical protein